MKKAGAMTPPPFDNAPSVSVLELLFLLLNFNPTSPGKLVPKRSMAGLADPHRINTCSRVLGSEVFAEPAVHRRSHLSAQQ